jgi:hypothetical protein
VGNLALALVAAVEPDVYVRTMIQSAERSEQDEVLVGCADARRARRSRGGAD